MGTCKIALRFDITEPLIIPLIIECVLRCHSLHQTENTINFIECVVAEIRAPIQRIQIDRGRIFFRDQLLFMVYGIKFHHNKPSSPLLHGKVERFQKTDKSEFYPAIDFGVER